MAEEKPKKKTKRPTGHSSKSKRVGRPSLGLNEDDIFRLAQYGMTDVEMCNILQISLSTLNNFRSIIQKGRGNLSQSIKRTQLELALKEKDKTMLIWVGKQYAGQSEKQVHTHHGELNPPQVTVYGSQIKPWKEEQKEKDKS
jgi:DNA-binding CsgD family transcriptional regulator